MSLNSRRHNEPGHEASHMHRYLLLCEDTNILVRVKIDIEKPFFYYLREEWKKKLGEMNIKSCGSSIKLGMSKRTGLAGTGPNPDRELAIGIFRTRTGPTVPPVPVLAGS